MTVRYIILILAISISTQLAAAEPTIDFDRDIRPILSENCFFCHGPDAKTREADLRLDVEAIAKEIAIVPGSTKKSSLSHRIWSDDENEVMPPPASKVSLTEQQKKLLDAWIEQGA
jgi:uncharacterized membrane protein